MAAVENKVDTHGVIEKLNLIKPFSIQQKATIAKLQTAFEKGNETGIKTHISSLETALANVAKGTYGQNVAAVKKIFKKILEELTDNSGETRGSETVKKTRQQSMDSPPSPLGNEEVSPQQNVGMLLGEQNVILKQNSRGDSRTKAKTATDNKHSKEAVGSGENALFGKFIAELRLILYNQQEKFSESTLAWCNTSDKQLIDDLQDDLKRFADTKREEGHILTGRLRQLRDSINSEKYDLPHAMKVKTSDPDTIALNVIRTELYMRHQRLVEMDEKLNTLEKKMSLRQNEKDSTSNKPEKQLVDKMEDSFRKLEQTISERLEEFENEQARIGEKLEHLVIFVTGTKEKSVQSLELSRDTIYKHITTLEGLLKERQKPGDGDGGGNNQKAFKGYVNEIKELEKEVDKGVFHEKNYTGNEFPKEAVKTLQSLRKTLQNRQEFWNNVQAEIENMTKEIQNKSYDVAAFQKRLNISKSNEPKEPFLCIGKIWRELDERLSSIAGAKLSGINPNIADLSDPNRPTKLAERYRELFDTEWTYAYEELEKARCLGNRDTCVMLVDILLSVHGQCIDIAKRQEKNIYNYLLNPTATTTHTESDTVLDTALTKTITDLRIPTARMSVKNVIKGLQPNDDSLGSILKYRNKCVEICWYMSLQSPPMVLERLNTTQAKFDRDRYSEFTRKGSKVDYVTWPPMLLHDGGPLMCKGVAQGK